MESWRSSESTHGSFARLDLNALWVSIRVMLIEGSILGHTRALSTTIFEHVEVGEYVHAHVVSAVMLIFSFLVLLTVSIANRRFPIHAS
jgi:ABC-type Fe3+ transport system permease subunit